MQDSEPSGAETARLAALKATGLLNTQPEDKFDRLTRLARQMFGCCILDDKPRAPLTQAERQSLRDLADCVEQAIGHVAWRCSRRSAWVRSWHAPS